MNVINQVTHELVLSPAFGIKYSTVADMLKGWEEGRDFKISPNGCYTSIRDLRPLSNNYSRIVLTKDFFEYIVP